VTNYVTTEIGKRFERLSAYAHTHGRRCNRHNRQPEIAERYPVRESRWSDVN
jgi:hypothetical protein